MPHARARRSFHGPLLASLPRSREAREARPVAALPTPLPASSLGREVLKAARSERPSGGDRERLLAGVLAALRGLTTGMP